MAKPLSTSLHGLLIRLTGYRPHIPERIDEDKLLAQASSFFGIEQSQINEMWQNYRTLSAEKNYNQLLGERKTLCMEEAFLIYIALSLYQPRSIIEIGTQFGKSTRRIIDIKNLLGLEAKITCFDIFDGVEFFNPDEAELLLKDITGRFKETVLDQYEPGFIYLDAHPYYLLQDVIQEVINQPGWVIAIHDCGRGLCNPYMIMSKNDLEYISSGRGVWERHVLAKFFGVSNPVGEKLDDVQTKTHHLRIFDTPHGLAVIKPQ